MNGLTEHKKITALELIDKVSWRKLAKMLDVPKSTLSDFLRSYKHTSYQNVEINNPPERGPKVLVFDIEYAPAKVLAFGRYKQNICQDFVMEEGYMLSFAAKWLNNPVIASYALPYYDAYEYDPKNDYSLVSDLHEMLDNADVIVAHNLKGYDWKTANTRFVYHGFDPISPVKLVDTLDIARHNFRFPNNKLDTIAQYLGVGEKMDTGGASLWRECMDGDSDSWKLMVEYNTVDVEVLENVYMKLRPWDKRHPNLAMYYPDSKPRCTVCGSLELAYTDKKAYTGVSEFSVYQCNNCGHHVRSRQTNLSKSKRESIMMNVQ